MNLEEALRIVRENEYIAIRLTTAMKRDMKECNEYSDSGEDKECMSCACNICVC